MMNIKQAYEALEQGKKVRHQIMDADDDFLVGIPPKYPNGYYPGSVPVDGWEIYEEPKPELLPCPFCGKKPFVRKDGEVICDTQGCSASFCAISVEVWNRRAPVAKPAEKDWLRVLLEKACEEFKKRFPGDRVQEILLEAYDLMTATARERGDLHENGSGWRLDK